MTASNVLPRRSPIPVIPIRTALLATAGTLAVAASLEIAVLVLGGHHALSDIPGRFVAWRVRPAWLPFEGVPIEYPVVVGYVSWVASWFGRRSSTYFLANGVLSAGMALTMTAILRARGGLRLWRWMVAPPLAFYAFHNWDLIAMVPAIAGLLAFDKKNDTAAGGLLALGASVKVFPGLALPPLAVLRWHRGDRRGAARLVGAFVIVTAVLNGPIAWRNWHAWVFPMSFQGGRSATWGSVWSWGFRAPGVQSLVSGHVEVSTDVLSVGVLIGALILISVLGVRRDLNAVAIGAAVVGAFMLSNKIYSPNYDLWIVPFFVLLPVSRRVWLGFAASATGVFVLVYGHFHGGWSSGVVETLLPPLIVLRAVSILVVIVNALHPARPSTVRGDGARRSRSRLLIPPDPVV